MPAPLVHTGPVSLNVFPPASPRLVLPETAGILGTVRAGPGVLVAQGTVIRSRGGSVSVGAGSAVLENAVVVGTPEHPVSVGRRTVFGHRSRLGLGCVVRAGAVVKQRSHFGEHVVVDGFPAVSVETLAGPPPAPGWAFSPDDLPEALP
jgi:carbonic anhydrase/acetyltransferase-like protein (isoleucine patch superfamily)